MSITSFMFIAGFLAIIAGFTLILLSILSTGREERESRGFGILFLGPIPIIFSGEKGWKRIITLLSFLLFLIFFLYFFLSHLST